MKSTLILFRKGHVVFSGFWIHPRRKVTWYKLSQVLQTRGSIFYVASLVHMHVHIHVGMIPTFVHRLYSSCSKATLLATRSGSCNKGYSNKEGCDGEEYYPTSRGGSPCQGSMRQKSIPGQYDKKSQPNKKSNSPQVDP